MYVCNVCMYEGNMYSIVFYSTWHTALRMTALLSDERKANTCMYSMYVYMYVCMHCMYVCMYVCTWMNEFMCRRRGWAAAGRSWLAIGTHHIVVEKLPYIHTYIHTYILTYTHT